MIRRGVSFLALVLIGVGAFELLRNANVIDRRVTLGPFVLMALGVWLLFAPRRWVGHHLWSFLVPVALIAVGVVILLEELDITPPDFSIGPVIVIVLGVALLLSAISRPSHWKRPPRGWAVTRGQPGSAGDELQIIALEGARSATIRVTHGAGGLVIGPTSDPSGLVQGTFGGGVEPKLRRSGDRAEVDLNQSWPRRGGPSPGGRTGAGTPRRDWTMGLSRTIPLVLDLRTGASDSRLDLRELTVTDLRVEAGASRLDLQLPAKGRTVARLRVGAAGVRITVPSGTAARIRTRQGLASVRVDPNRFSRIGNEYLSKGFESAADRVELDIDAGAADVTVS